MLYTTMAQKEILSYRKAIERRLTVLYMHSDIASVALMPQAVTVLMNGVGCMESRHLADSEYC